MWTFLLVGLTTVTLAQTVPEVPPFDPSPEIPQPNDDSTIPPRPFAQGEHEKKKDSAKKAPRVNKSSEQIPPPETGDQEDEVATPE